MDDGEKRRDMYYTYFISRRRKMRRDLLVDAVDVLFLVGFLAGSGGGGGIRGLFCRHRRRHAVVRVDSTSFHFHWMVM